MPLFKRKFNVLFVCTENICRSPLAEGLLRHHARLAGMAGGLRVRSAGTRASQPGVRPDQRALRIAAAEGVRLDRIRARRVEPEQLLRQDLIVAMERSHVRDLQDLCPPDVHDRIHLLLSFDPDQALVDVPDPYYGSYERFAEVYRIIDRAVQGLLERLPR